MLLRKQQLGRKHRRLWMRLRVQLRWLQTESERSQFIICPPPLEVTNAALGKTLPRAAHPYCYQALIMFIRVLGEESEALAWNGTCPFNDVQPGTNGAKYVGYASRPSHPPPLRKNSRPSRFPPEAARRRR